LEFKRHLAPVLSENDFRAGSLLSEHLDIRRLFPGIFFGWEKWLRLGGELFHAA
jgi:hypothetical protein